MSGANVRDDGIEAGASASLRSLLHNDDHATVAVQRTEVCLSCCPSADPRPMLLGNPAACLVSPSRTTRRPRMRHLRFDAGPNSPARWPPTPQQRGLWPRSGLQSPKVSIDKGLNPWSAATSWTRSRSALGLQLLEPVQDDVYLPRRCVGVSGRVQKPTPVGRYTVPIIECRQIWSCE